MTEISENVFGDAVSPYPWKTRPMSENPNLTELIDANGERIAVFQNRNNAIVASGGPMMAERWLWFKDFIKDVLGQADQCFKLCMDEMGLSVSNVVRKGQNTDENQKGAN